MKGLLLKDIYTLLRQSRIFLLMIVVFSVLPGYSMTGFAIVYASMLPYTALAYDERCKWDIYATMMPYTRRQLVLSKYVLGWGAVFCALVLSAVAKLISGVVMSSMDFEALLPLPAVAGIALLLLSISLPAMFYFGVENGRIVFILFIVVVTVSAASLASGIIEFDNVLAPILIFGAPALGIASQFVSVPLSAKLYAAKHEK